MLEEPQYTIKLDNFEGPFDLLFHLIKKNKMDIYNIEIVKITDQYMEYIHSAEKYNLDIASEFLVTASTLLLLKSKMLLPRKDEVSEQSEEDIKAELVTKLVEYKKYKDLSGLLATNYGEYSKSFYRAFEPIKIEKLKPENKNYPSELIPNIYENILKKNYEKQNPNSRNIEQILKKEKITIKSKVREIFKRFLKTPKFKFSEVFNMKKESKLDVVTGFMAVLELAKVNRVEIKQSKLFGEIEVSKK